MALGPNPLSTLLIETANQMLAVRERRTRSITDLTGLLQTVHDIDEAARVLPRFLGPLFAPHAGALYIAKPSLNYLEALVRWGDASFTDGFDFADCWALRRGEVYEVDSSGLVCPHSDAHTAHEYLCAPMVSQGKTFGLLHVAYASAAVGDTAKRERQEQARYITEQLTLGLANLRLREALRHQALRDPLTGLFNRRYLEDSLERELARTKRDGQPFSLLMMDLDHFKRFNDTYGHEAGDAVLRALGCTLIECSRGGDIACRFGGEEFAVMLPGANSDQASAWATRLIERVRAMTVRSGDQLLAGVTISVGLACYPKNGQDAEVLVRAADAALYEAKHTGRDRLVVAEKTESAAA